MNKDIQELLAVYALGGLTAEEQREVEEYLAAHPEARAEVHALLETTAALRHLAPPVEPPAHIAENLMMRVTADASKRHPQRSIRKASVIDRIRPIFSNPAFGAVSAALAILLLFWTIVLNLQMRQLDQQITDQLTNTEEIQARLELLQEENERFETRISLLETDNEFLQQQVNTLIEERDAAQLLASSLEAENARLAGSLAEAGAQNLALMEEILVVQGLNALLEEELQASNEIVNIFTSQTTQQALLPGTEMQPQAAGHFLFDPEVDVAVLFVDGLPVLEQGEVYQVLLIRDDGHDTAETFAVDVEGRQALIVHAQAPLNTFTSIGVSVEPAGGSLQRTGDIILLGELINS